MGHHPSAAVDHVDVEQLALVELAAHDPELAQARHHRHGTHHLALAAPHRLGDDEQRLPDGDGEERVADHRLALQAAQDTLLQELVEHGLLQPLPRPRARALGVDDAHRVEAAAHLVFVAAQGSARAQAGDALGERLLGRLQLERPCDGRHLAAQAVDVDRDLLGKAARLVELGGLLIQLQDLLAARDELPGGADEREHADAEQQQQEREQDAPAAARQPAHHRLHAPPVAAPGGVRSAASRARTTS